MINWGHPTKFFTNIECPMSQWKKSNEVTEYPYSLDIPLDYIKSTSMATVIFNEDDIKYDDYAPICQTLDGIVRIYAKNIPFKNIIISEIQCYDL